MSVLITSLMLLCVLATTDAKDLVINGAGTRITKALYQKAAFAYRFVSDAVAVRYTPTGSGRSTCRLMSHGKRCDATDAQKPLHVDFAASDSLLKVVASSVPPGMHYVWRSTLCVAYAVQLQAPHVLWLPVSKLTQADA